MSDDMTEREWKLVEKSNVYFLLMAYISIHPAATAAANYL